MSAESRKERREAAHLSALPNPTSIFDPVKQKVLTALASGFSDVIIESAGSNPNDFFQDTSNGQRQSFRWVHVTLLIRENMGHPVPIEPTADAATAEPEKESI
jgi:hypothetical protein